MSEQDMVERAARAMFDEAGMEANLWPELRMGYMMSARAAIEAMREPTEAMCKAPRMSGRGLCLEEFSEKEIWHAMIDKALGR